MTTYKTFILNYIKKNIGNTTKISSQNATWAIRNI